jgi:plasmid maintenance system antidote protein VapI
MELVHDYDAQVWEKPVSHFELLQRFRAYATGQLSQKAVAEQLGVSTAYVNDILHGRREISLYVGRKLGFEKVTVFLARGDE